ncbi:hypothetical protein BC835DRAFT_1418232 [Cytidiella melzeri]|nr:hypothetical protein BC835DRAFT_1418232 [Cytidiella melzeri]
MPRSSPILELLQSQDNGSLETRLDKLRIAEALTARDHAVHQMEALCASNRSKDTVIGKLQREKAELEVKLAGISAKPLPGILNIDLGTDKQEAENQSRKLEKENAVLKSKVDLLLQQHESFKSPRIEHTLMSPLLDEDFKSPPIDVHSPHFSNPPEFAVLQEAEAVTQARYAVLANLPIPPELPIDMLVPIVIPPPFTLQDFLSTASGHLKIQLANYRIFQENTTFWCPDREEHGYYVTPVYKCNTNPRAATAHRWTTLDLASDIDRSTECFYTKDGKWYYAGVYKTFRLRNITPQEWLQLPATTTQALVKETLSLRKNTSPQNIYETNQQYLAGALKAACIGLQCIGFNEDLYNGLLALAHGCSKTGRWRIPAAGLGTGPPTWSTATSPSLGFEVVKPTTLVSGLGLGSGLKELDGAGAEKMLSPQLGREMPC